MVKAHRLPPTKKKTKIRPAYAFRHHLFSFRNYSSHLEITGVDIIVSRLQRVKHIFWWRFIACVNIGSFIIENQSIKYEFDEINPIKRCFQSTRKHLNFLFASHNMRSDSHWYRCLCVIASFAPPTAPSDDAFDSPTVCVWQRLFQQKRRRFYLSHKALLGARMPAKKQSAAPSTTMNNSFFVGAVSSRDISEWKRRGETKTTMNYEHFKSMKKKQQVKPRYKNRMTCRSIRVTKSHNYDSTHRNHLLANKIKRIIRTSWS